MRLSDPRRVWGGKEMDAAVGLLKRGGKYTAAERGGKVWILDPFFFFF